MKPKPEKKPKVTNRQEDEDFGDSDNDYIDPSIEKYFKKSRKKKHLLFSHYFH
jgi:hypothetical protein